MPRVPTLKNREVLPAAGGSFLSSDVPSGSFGASKGRAIARVGDKVQEVGDIALKYALAQQEVDDKREASKLDVEFSSFLRQLTYGDETGGGYLNEKGENAIGQFGPTEEAIIRKRQELFESASNGNVKQLFKEASRSRKDRTMSQYMQHVAKERVAANDAVDDARIKEAQDDAAAAQGDPKILERSLVISEETIRDKGERKGWSDEQIESEVESAKTKVISRTIGAMLYNDIKGAKRLFATYYNEIDGINRVAIQKQLDARSRQLISDMDRLERIGARRKKEEQQAHYENALVNVYNLNTTLDHAVDLLDSGRISGSHFTKLQAAMKRRDEETSNPEEFLDMQIRTLKGEASYEEISNAPGLSFADRGKLVTTHKQVMDQGGILNRADVKNAREHIERVIIGPKGRRDKYDVEEGPRLANAITEFHERVQEGQDVVEARDKVLAKYNPPGLSVPLQIRALGKPAFWEGSLSGSRQTMEQAYNKSRNNLEANKDGMSRTDYLQALKAYNKMKGLISTMEQ